MVQISLTLQEINQINMALVSYRSLFKDINVDMPLTDSLIEKFVSLRNK